MPRPQSVFPGQVYGHLTVLSEAPGGAAARVFVCRCVCGTDLEVRGKNLRSRNSRSCGCRSNRVEQRRHEMSGYKSWGGLVQRCRNPNAPKWPIYGARGITVCERWLSGFGYFYADMGERPDGMSIDRIDNDGGYWCGHCVECVALGRSANCRWATASEQRRNQRQAAVA